MARTRTHKRPLYPHGYFTTDPRTVAHLVAGDVIYVEGGCGDARYAYVSEILDVTRDARGARFTTLELREDRMWITVASTDANVIRRVRGGVPGVDPVAYALEVANARATLAARHAGRTARVAAGSARFRTVAERVTVPGPAGTPGALPTPDELASADRAVILAAYRAAWAALARTGKVTPDVASAPADAPAVPVNGWRVVRPVTYTLPAWRPGDVVGYGEAWRAARDAVKASGLAARITRTSRRTFVVTCANPADQVRADGVVRAAALVFSADSHSWR